LDPRSKGQDLLICALSSNEWRERSWFLSFYGEGPYTAVLKKLVQCNDLSSKVGFCGYLADVRKIWEDNHALILPSRSEGLPLALVEASLSNRVSIVTDVAGNTELIVDNISGFVAPSPTINHLQEAMERAWCNQGNWRLMGHRAGDLARQNISPNPAMVFAERLVELV
jgi:glycosyltransferase involved in cell wall biosynthesis